MEPVWRGVGHVGEPRQNGRETCQALVDYLMEDCGLNAEYVVVYDRDQEMVVVKSKEDPASSEESSKPG